MAPWVIPQNGFRVRALPEVHAPHYICRQHPAAARPGCPRIVQRSDLMGAAALRDFPVVIAVPVAWGEMDAFGHVNNIVYFRYFESARIAYLDAIGFRGDAASGGSGPILASTHCRFRRPLAYPETVQVGARTTEVGADRFTMEYRIVSDSSGEIVAEGGGVIVAYDYVTTCKTALPETVRACIRDVERTVEHELEV